MRSICDTLSNLQRSFELPQKPWDHGHKKRKWLKQPQSLFHLAIPHKSHHFCCFDECAVRHISSSNVNINSKSYVSRLSFRFLWLCVILLKRLEIQKN